MGHSQEVELVRVHLDALCVDRRVQRALDVKRAATMARDFKPAGFGYVAVSRREDGMYIVDGQHRVAALRAMDDERLAVALRSLGTGPRHEIICEVFSGLSLQDEAALFRVRNNFKQIKVHERFRVRVIEGDTAAVFLDKALERHGWTVAPHPTRARGTFQAVKSLEWVYDGAGIRPSTVHPSEVENTLAVVTGSWGHDQMAVRAEIVRGLGLFLVQYGESVDFAKLIKELSTLEGGPAALIGKARNLNTFRGGGVASAMGEIMLTLHNSRRRTNLLPDWRRGKVAPQDAPGGDGE